ncbi:MAG: globin [Hyphomonadaceae bacterium]
MDAEVQVSFEGATEIEQSLEIAAAHSGDLTAAIYARLFAEYPETEALFVMDRDGQVRGAMLAHVFETIFDFIGERRYAHRFIGAEILTHDGYGVDPAAFAAFFGVVRDEVRSACGSAWTDTMDDAWRRLLSDLGAYTACPVS